MSAILRLLAAVVFAVFVASAWATPSEAHAGHGAPPAAEQSRPPSSVGDVSSGAAAEDRAADVAASGANADCGGHGPADKTRCCSSVCHAVLSEELGVLTPLPIEATSGPSLPEPTAHSGPAINVKRPPRPLAATVG
ncbi:hypothetical protein [Methylopila sp. Yamaguchi]|uniref:hypothetical protein n=1 Tax=Methylopila sp. Yamaguchi TaxID=1437817 RepID=UPI000CA72233|nr:hypothetical protein [Methylopila sp. Yamaguchi]GBD49721.1 hypothetical protein METY_2934 [Methylopila sp. Yamaguchi]